jgi:hypothetical protein
MRVVTLVVGCLCASLLAGKAGADLGPVASIAASILWATVNHILYEIRDSRK